MEYLKEADAIYRFRHIVFPSERCQSEKILQAQLVDTRKYWQVEIIENSCIETRVKVYNEISPEPLGNPSGSTLGISLGHRLYFIVPLLSSQYSYSIFNSQLPNIGILKLSYSNISLSAKCIS